MPIASPRTWDIFCRVIDNFGDVGVCWRLALQLAREHGAAVRLWLDDLAALHALVPGVDVGRERQSVEGIEVCRWQESFAGVQPAEVVVEGFGCGLPDAYAAAVAGRDPQPVWVVLEYLSAEPWVREHHGLPSPHPRWPVTRHYYFPGFEADTGGVLRERDLFARRDAFDETDRRHFWQSLGFEPAASGALTISMFAYGHAPLTELLAEWERGAGTVVLAVPQGTLTARVREFFADGGPGCCLRRGNLEARLLPFLPQARYDELLWACDCNFVRGEDSFVRAQWAARPLVWQIYPQDEQAHHRKLEAFLDHYCADLPPAAAAAVRGLWRSWNGLDGPGGAGVAWRAFVGQFSALGAHARKWAGRLGGSGDLAGKLAQFCRDRLK